ncbi:hypothetical protein CBL_06157 [Carabus blaptoides fortunei]
MGNQKSLDGFQLERLTGNLHRWGPGRHRPTPVVPSRHWLRAPVTWCSGSISVPDPRSDSSPAYGKRYRCSDTHSNRTRKLWASAKVIFKCQRVCEQLKATAISDPKWPSLKARSGKLRPVSRTLLLEGVSRGLGTATQNLLVQRQDSLDTLCIGGQPWSLTPFESRNRGTPDIFSHNCATANRPTCAAAVARDVYKCTLVAPSDRPSTVGHTGGNYDITHRGEGESVLELATVEFSL